MTQVTFDHFMQVDIRIGRVVRVEDFPKARKPAFRLWIDFGELGVKRSSAQLTHLYTKEDLLERYIVAVVNFPPRQVADFISEVLVLGAVIDEKEVVLLRPDRPVEPGVRIA